MTMACAKSRGFKIGNLYRVKPSGGDGYYYVPGMIVEFSHDDKSWCPAFTYICGPVGKEYNVVDRPQIYIDLEDLEPLGTSPTAEKMTDTPSKEILLTYIQQYYPNDATLHHMVNSI